MATDLPIACSLDAAGLRDRLGEVSAIGADGLLSADVGDRRARLRFRAEVADRLAAVVAAESDCCPWLELDLALHGDGVELVLTAPPEGAAAMRELAAAFGRP